MKRLTEDSPGGRVLAWLARMVYRRPALFFYPQIVLFVLSLLFTVRYLKIDMSRTNLVGANQKYEQNFLKFKKEFQLQGDLVVVVESGDPDKNRQFVDRLGPKLEAARIKVPAEPGSKQLIETNLFTDVFYKKDLKMLGTKALLFVPATNLATLRTTLQGYRPFIQRFANATNLTLLFGLINEQFRTAKQEDTAENRALVGALPMLEHIVDDARVSMETPGKPPSPGFSALLNAGYEDTYITFDHNRIFLVTSLASTVDLNGDAVTRLRSLVEETKLEVPGLNVGVTGEPVLDHDEMTQSKKDTTIASIVSLIICTLIFIYGYNETGRPIKATICLLVGLAYTMAFATLTIGHLNILTVTFVPMLIGLAIDFGVHLITRYEEELRRGRSEEEALTKAMVFTGQGIFTGAFTTAGAFLAMRLTNFRGIQEMGVICGGGLLVCLVPMMTLLPVLLLRGRQNVIDHQQGDLAAKRARIENIWLQRPVWVAAVTVTLCGLAGWQSSKVRFDYDLRDMQSAGLPAVEFEKKLINAGTESGTTNSGKSIIYAAVVADSPQQALELEEKIKPLSTVAEKEGVVSIAQYLTEDQTEKLRLVGEIKRDLSSIHFAQADRRPVNILELSRTLYSLYGYLGFASDKVGTNEPALRQKFLSLRGAIEDLRKKMLQGDAAKSELHARKLAEFQQAMFDDVRATFENLQNQDTSGRMRVEDLPNVLRDRFVGVTGKILLQVYPKKDVWERKNQEEFIGQLRTIDPNVTGTPVQLYEYTYLLKVSYEQAALFSLGAIVLLVFFHFRTVSSVILSLLPVAIGTIWLLGMMGLFDIMFNPANIMTLPLVIGIGVTNGIHILNRFAEEQHPSILARSTGKAVFVSGLTAIAGFGSLILARHQGIRSLGYVMAAGITTCMIAALTFLPALLNLILHLRQKKQQPSVDNAPSTLGREEPR
jgi:hopanoid biosynthesis associated RND transporter like protein HpnN